MLPVRLSLTLLPVLVIVGCGGGSGPSESTVAANVKHAVQERLDTNPSHYGAEAGMTVKAVTCAESGTRVFECVGTLSDDETFNSTVHVSQDGKRFVTEG